jgi:hypothetical protein
LSEDEELDILDYLKKCYGKKAKNLTVDWLVITPYHTMLYADQKFRSELFKYAVVSSIPFVYLVGRTEVSFALNLNYLTAKRVQMSRKFMWAM